jgi:hypothetical protein
MTNLMLRNLGQLGPRLPRARMMRLFRTHPLDQVLRHRWAWGVGVGVGVIFYIIIGHRSNKIQSLLDIDDFFHLFSIKHKLIN